MQWNNDRKYQQETQFADVYQDVQPSYSTRRLNADIQEFSIDNIEQKLGTYTPTAAQDDDYAVMRGDVKPSDQTLNLSYARNYSADAQAASKPRLSVKTKVAIAGYAVLVLALVLAVTLCGVSVTGSFAATSALNTEYTEAVGTVAALTEQSSTEDRAALAQRAAELGYIDASRSNTQTYTEIATRPAQNFNVESNWFDALCDWLSGAFGG